MRRNDGLTTIGHIAGSVGVATSTLRYYEREGLLKPTGRSDAGYRLYDPASVERLRFIRTAQGVGFALEDIKAMLALDARTSCKKVQRVIEDRLAEVAGRVAELKSVERTLKAALKRCRGSRKGCPVLLDLRGSRRSAICETD